MKYRFFATPNHLIKVRKRKIMSTEYEYKPLLRFDANGEYVIEETERNQWLLKRMKKKFRFEPVEEAPAFLCKKCGEGFDNAGNFLAHCRKEHPKEA
jgi:hypothetical protein